MGKHTKVLIVGAGPTGLMAGLLLRKLGVDCRIIDKKNQLNTTSNAAVIHSRTLEIFDQLGFANAIIKRGVECQKFCLHLEKNKILTLNFGSVRSPFPYVLALSQADTEAFLHEELVKHGGEVEWNTQLIHVEQNDLKVKAKLEAAGVESETESDWLIGADGFNSATRELLKVPTKHAHLGLHFAIFEARLKDTAAFKGFHAFPNADGPILFVELKNRFRIFVEVSFEPDFSNDKAYSFKSLNEIIARRIGFNAIFEAPSYESHFAVHENIISTYRQGRIFWAGDAAHTHSPVGGQGMNTGLQDAHNLAWKLNEVIQRRAHTKLLDSYQTERLPVAKRLVEASSRATYLFSIRNRWLNSTRNLFISTIFNFPTLLAKLVRVLSETEIKYKNGFFSLSQAFRKRILVARAKYQLTIAFTPGLENKTEIINFSNKHFPGVFHFIELTQKEFTKAESRFKDKTYLILRPDQFVALEGKNTSDLFDFMQKYFVNS